MYTDSFLWDSLELVESPHVVLSQVNALARRELWMSPSPTLFICITAACVHADVAGSWMMHDVQIQSLQC